MERVVGQPSNGRQRVEAGGELQHQSCFTNETSDLLIRSVFYQEAAEHLLGAEGTVRTMQLHTVLENHQKASLSPDCSEK